ncbi:MAG: hypothetical protein H6981_10095 [Gammaproteobacteria bacterium]|nr:hypothetical protein [Gammaproteobacteria bacterium]MCP5137138.1 hypothetical protein [Gammaproteobacteria bacterium]
MKIFPKFLLSMAAIALVSGIQSASANSVLFQPGPGLNDGTDTGTLTAGKDSNNGGAGDAGIHWISNPSWSSTPGRAYFEFDVLSAVGAGANISSASLTFTNVFRLSQYYNSWPRAETFVLSTLNADWDEMTVSGYPASTVYQTVVINPNTEWTLVPDPLGSGYNALVGTTTYDITALAQSWVDDAAANYGVSYGIGGSVYPYNTIDPYVVSSDATGDMAAWRPLLQIEYDGVATSGVPVPGGLVLLLTGLGLPAIRRRTH